MVWRQFRLYMFSHLLQIWNATICIQLLWGKQEVERGFGAPPPPATSMAFTWWPCAAIHQGEWHTCAASWMSQLLNPDASFCPPASSLITILSLRVINLSHNGVCLPPAQSPSLRHSLLLLLNIYNYGKTSISMPPLIRILSEELSATGAVPVPAPTLVIWLVLNRSPDTESVFFFFLLF